MSCIFIGMPRKKGRKMANGNANDKDMVRSHRVVAAAQNNFVLEDLGRRPINSHITQTPPRVISNQIHWFSFTANAALSVSGSSDTERNDQFNLNGTQAASSIAALFDQYCIYSVTVSYVAAPTEFNTISTSPGTYYTSLGRLTTAIDYDSVGNLGSEGAVQQYASSNTTNLELGQAVQRFVKPCVDSSLYVSSVSSGYAPSRLWLDAGTNNIPHYGVRAYFSGSNAAFQCNIIYNFVVGARNNL